MKTNIKLSIAANAGIEKYLHIQGRIYMSEKIKLVTEIAILHKKSGNETIFITAKNERLL